MAIDFPPAVLSTQEKIVEKLLWYNVFTHNNARNKLGGQPFGNQYRLYNGSDDDPLLNQNIESLTTDQTALDAINTLPHHRMVDDPNGYASHGGRSSGTVRAHVALPE
jgi:hypothetical protein